MSATHTLNPEFLFWAARRSVHILICLQFTPARSCSHVSVPKAWIQTRSPVEMEKRDALVTRTSRTIDIFNSLTRAPYKREKCQLIKLHRRAASYVPPWPYSIISECHSEIYNARGKMVPSILWAHPVDVSHLESWIPYMPGPSHKFARAISCNFCNTMRQLLTEINWYPLLKQIYQSVIGQVEIMAGGDTA